MRAALKRAAIALLAAPRRRRSGTGRTARLAALALLAACQRGPATGSGPPPIPVRVGEVTRRDVPIRVAEVGTVTPLDSVAVRSLVDGQIQRVLFREGDEVSRGQRLFQLDPRPFQAALDQALATLARDRAQLENARVDLGRQAALVGDGYVTQQQYDAARTAVATLEATVASDEAAIEMARLNLQYCRIDSPIDGRTGRLQVQAGNVIQKNGATPLVVIERLRPISVAFSVPQDLLPRILGRAGLPVEALPAGDQAPRRGTLEFVDNAVDAATGTIFLKATFPNQDRGLWPGQSAQVTLVLGERKGAVVAPATAVEQGQEGSHVFVVKPDGTVDSVPVKVVSADAREAVVEGLEPGQTVVTDGQLRLAPGARVQVAGPGRAAVAGASP